MKNNEPCIKIGEIRFGGLVVPIRQLTAANRYTSGVIGFADLPETLGQQFDKYMTCAACPGAGFTYLHDFVHFMGSKGLKGELTWDEQTDAQIDEVCAATKANADLFGRQRSSILDTLRDEGAID